ncbi:transglutaminase-like domain-containing protein [Candidatus Latescibacterota bacterium]
MKRYSFIILAIFVFITAFQPVQAAQKVTTSWGGNAEMIYDTGFMHMLMRYPGNGVSLFNMELIHNDAPGAGLSEKGVTSDVIWGENRARKILYIDDTRANKAFLVIFVFTQGKTPLEFNVNGNISRVENWDMRQNQETYRWAEFPVKWMQNGANTIELYCPGATSRNDGWEIYIARADEFAAGGGNPADVGKTSFKSADGGETWKESPFGPLGQTRAEYSIRISLDRYVKSGWLASPVIDLWKGDSEGFIIPQREIRNMRLRVRSEAPEETNIEYYFRKGSEPNPLSDNWSEYEFIGEGETIDFTTGGADLNRRYVQFKAELSTTNPLKSPVVRSADITAELLERIPLHDNVYIVDIDNAPIKYSSINWEWEKDDRPEFTKLRELENLDEVIVGARTEFDAQVKLLDYVTKRWRHTSPLPEYPGWDALSILERIDNAGGGGMCIQFNNTLGGMCMAYGWQARLVNVVGHEICEVWNDEYGKWIFLDADLENHYHYDIQSGEPLNMLEMHNMYLDYFFPDRPIDWMNDMIKWEDISDNNPPPVKRGSLTHQDGTRLSGFICAAFMRIVPRNNWYEKPYPRPLTHGSSWWPWDGYINWYDDRTPPKRQYTWHTDKSADMWPDLNKVHIDATQGFGNDRLFLRFETYTPNFSHFEVNADGSGWKKVGQRWTWLFQSGRNELEVRAVSKLDVKGKPSSVVINHNNAPFAEVR